MNQSTKSIGLSLYYSLLKSISDALSEDTTICQSRCRDQVIGAAGIKVLHLPLCGAGDVGCGTIKVDPGDCCRSGRCCHRGCEFIHAVTSGVDTPQNIRLAGHAPQDIILRGFRGSHGTDIPAGGMRASGGIANWWKCLFSTIENYPSQRSFMYI